MLNITLSNITLNQWIDYTNAVQPIDAELSAVMELKSYRKPVLLTSMHVKRAYFTYSFFAGIDYAEATATVFVDDVMEWFNEGFCKMFEGEPEAWERVANENWHLPKPELTPTSPITFGEFIDSKMVTQANEGRSKWELLRYICAIYLRPHGERYDPQFIEESSERFNLVGQLPMTTVMSVANFFEHLNTYADEHFPIFQESEDSGGDNVKAHMSRWGWINFLKEMAKTKAFDIQGSNMNSIDCVRATNACEVLTWASEEKEHNIAANADQEERMRK